MNVRVKEYWTEVEKLEKRNVYTRDRRKQSETEMWYSALTDHAMKENHVIDWDSVKIIEKERVDLARWIRECHSHQEM